MDKNNFTPDESLLLISKTIEETKQKFQENGHILIFWGSLTCIVFLSQYVLELLGLHKKFDIIWTTILFPLGAIYMFIYIRRTTKKNSIPKTIFTRVIGTMGWVVGFNLMLLGFIFSDQLGEAIVPVFLILFALFAIMTGVFIKFKPLTICGFLLNLLAFGTFLLDPSYHGFSLMLGAIVGFIIPGILLNNARRKKHV